MTPTPTSELSENGFEMLRAAVNTARTHGCRSVASLRKRLLAAWPERATDIQEALVFWANSTRQRHPDGPPNT